MAGTRCRYNPRVLPGSKPLGWSPSARVEGVLRPPASKSIAQRALLCATIADPSAGPSTFLGLDSGADLRAALAFARALATDVTVDDDAGSASVLGTGPRSLRPAGPLSAQESGTLARFASALLALHGRAPARVEASGSLRARRSEPLVRALRSAGAGMDPDGGEHAGTWPLAIRPVPVAPDSIELVDPVSSQEVSALWLAAAGLPQETTVRVRGAIPSAPYLELTRRELLRFGARLEGDAHELRIRGPLRPAGVALEADASGAAVALAAACLSGGALRVEGIPADSAQGDVRIVEHLRAFGCEARRAGELLVAGGRPTRAADLDLTGEPDLAPVLAAVAAGAAASSGATSTLRGLGTLRGKESDRLAVLGAGLARAGFAVETGDAFLRVGPGHGRSATGPVLLLDPRGDHRMAFAFALLGLVRAAILVERPDCVQKSWPSFWTDLERLGAATSPPSPPSPPSPRGTQGAT